MDVFLRLVINVLEEGLIYGIMAVGVYITYRVLHFPDLSVDGTFPLGACVTAALIAAGVHPVAALACAFVCGCAAGAVTGFLHVKLGITDLLSGILVMTGLWSVNLVVLGGRSVLPFYNSPTVFNSGLAACLPEALYPRRVLIILLGIVLVVKILVDLYYKTQSGLLLRAAGDNSQFVTSLGISPGGMKMLGLMLGNGLAALSGSVLAQQAESAPESGQYPDGVFTGSGEAYGGDVTVEVTIENGRIASVEILDGASSGRRPWCFSAPLHTRPAWWRPCSWACRPTTSNC